MSVASLLAQGRAAAERLMVDTCTIRRRTGETTSPVTGAVTPTYSTIYTGRCRVQQSAIGASATAAEVGEARRLMLSLEVQVPMTVTGVRAEDEVLVTASAHDEDLVDRVLIVKALAHKTHSTSRRIGVEERTS